MPISRRHPCAAISLACALVIAAPLAAQSPNTTVFELAPGGNEARYRVNEQLVGPGAYAAYGQVPTVDVVPKEFVGVKWPLTAPATFELRGDLTIHGVTKPWSWHVTANPKDGGFAGRATTTFKFGDFGMTPPTSFRVLSVEDKVTLEYDFAFVPKR